MQDLRKLAADVVGRAALQERFGQRQLSALDAVTLEKIASADPELLKVAASFGSQNILKVYEDLGGQYKEAVSNSWVRAKATSAAHKMLEAPWHKSVDSGTLPTLETKITQSKLLARAAESARRAKDEPYRAHREKREALAQAVRGAADHANRRLGVKEADAPGPAGHTIRAINDPTGKPVGYALLKPEHLKLSNDELYNTVYKPRMSGAMNKHGGIGASLLGGAGKLIGQAALHPGAATAIGAGIGAAGGAVAGGEGHRLSGALGGAAAGGALGAGVSYGGHRLGQAVMKTIANDPATMAHLSKMHPGNADLIHAWRNKPWIGGAAHMQAATGGNVVSEMANQNKGYSY